MLRWLLRAPHFLAAVHVYCRQPYCSVPLYPGSVGPPSRLLVNERHREKTQAVAADDKRGAVRCFLICAISVPIVQLQTSPKFLVLMSQV